MARQSPDAPPPGRSRLDPRTWSVGQIILALLVLAGLVMMLTWDRGHFEQRQPPAVQKTETK